MTRKISPIKLLGHLQPSNKWVVSSNLKFPKGRCVFFFNQGDFPVKRRPAASSREWIEGFEQRENWRLRGGARNTASPWTPENSMALRGKTGKSWTKKGGQIWDFYMKKLRNVYFICANIFFELDGVLWSFLLGYLGRFVDFWSMFLMKLGFWDCMAEDSTHFPWNAWDPRSNHLQARQRLSIFCVSPSAQPPGAPNTQKRHPSAGTKVTPMLRSQIFGIISPDPCRWHTNDTAL